ncbi:MAG: DUF3298 domain-containing protein [Clostridia bacterium]|nr:DUF3298 domain-containing protein [Clostridia bacterium]
MKSKIIIVLSLLLILLSGCKKEISNQNQISPSPTDNMVEEFTQKILVRSKAMVEETKEYIVAMDIPSITIPDGEEVQEEINQVILDLSSLSVEKFKEKVADLEEKVNQSYIGMDYEVTTEEYGFFSISLLINDYYGEDEVMTYRRSFNYHFGDLGELSLKDLLGEDYIMLLNNEIKTQIDLSPEMKSAVINRGFTGIDDNTRFYLKEGKLVVYFERKSIFNYDYGIPAFEIPTSIYNPYSLKN